MQGNEYIKEGQKKGHRVGKKRQKENIKLIYTPMPKNWIRISKCLKFVA